MFKKEENTLEFKRVNDVGYEKISPITNDFTTCLVFQFNQDVCLLPAYDVILHKNENIFEGEVSVKKAFERTYFEKKGAAYSSVARDYYVPEVIIPLRFEVKDWGEQVSVLKPTGNIVTKYIDEVIDVKEFVSEELWNKLNEDDKIYLRAVNTESLREDLTEYLNITPRQNTPYNLVLFELSKNYDLFKKSVEKEYKTIYIDKWENADIRIKAGDKEFTLNKYALACQGFYSASITMDIKDEIIKAVKKDDFVEVK